MRTSDRRELGREGREESGMEKERSHINDMINTITNIQSICIWTLHVRHLHMQCTVLLINIPSTDSSNPLKCTDCT